MSATARPTSTDSLTKLINQPAHGFTDIGLIVTYSLASTKYVLSAADSLLNAQSPLMISIIVDSDNFYVTQEGWVSGITTAETPFTTGTQYYLSVGNPGHLTATVPAAAGNIVSALFVADTTTSGYFLQTGGTLIGGASFPSVWLTVNIDTQMVPDTGYYCNSASNINLTLPASMITGQSVGAQTINTGGFTILQNDGTPVGPAPGNQIINFVPGSSTPGSGGSVALAPTLGVYSGSIIINSQDGGTNFGVVSSVGNFTVT